MAAAVQAVHNSTSSNRQQASSTAPVLEFSCLFTRDLRRKQKRWQDGRLKYHTFNKRIMVYDDRGNYVGDSHWREDYELNDGDEVELERGGVIVQVAECTGSRDQDLSELVDKRAQEKAERQAAALARRPPTLDATATSHTAAPHFQLRHKPLHHLIGTPTGHHGRALIPPQSPYEERQGMAASSLDATTRPVKRRKREASPPSKSGYAQSLFGAALTLSGTPASTPPIRARLSKPPPNPDNEEDSDSTLILGHTVTKPTRKERPANPLRPTLINKTSRVSAALAHEMDEVQLSSTVAENGPSPEVQHATLDDISPLRSNRTGYIRGRVIERPSLSPVSVNPSRSKSDSDEWNIAKFGSERNMRKDKILAEPSRNSRTEHTSLVSSIKTSVPSQGPPPIPKQKNVPNSKGFNQEQHRLNRQTTMSEPRTELRIKPRKKRGLLMISENVETSNSSSSRTKSRIDSHSHSTSDNETTGRESNGALYGECSLDIKSRTPNHAQQEKRNGIGPSEELGSVDFSYTSRSLQHPGFNIEEPVLSRSLLSNKPKLRRQGAETTIDGRNKSADQESLNNTDIPESETALEDPVLDEPTRSPERRKQPPRKKKRTPIEDNMDSSMAKRSEDRRMTSDEEDLSSGSVLAPRLTHLGRKSIRSKEIIGFIFSDEEIHIPGAPSRGGGGGKCGKQSLVDNLPATRSELQTTTSETDRAAMIATNSDRDGAHERAHGLDPAAEEIATMEGRIVPQSVQTKNIDEVHVEATSRSPQKRARYGAVQADADLDVKRPVLENTAVVSLPPKRMLNPATRGKKAAKPSDAAGQAPQCPLPPETVPGNPSLNSRKSENTGRGSRSESRTKEPIRTPMPGFARANGGPWSREAHDLFEFTRPP